MVGAGKYDDAATAAQKSCDADGVILIIIGGNKGEGFSAQFRDPGMHLKIPKILRALADMIEEEHSN